MKKSLRITLAVIFAIVFMFPNTAYASDETVNEWTDIELTDEELHEFAPLTYVKERSSSLISAYSFGIKKSGSYLIVAGETICIVGVVKSGFKDVVVQRRKSSSDSWSTYVKFGDSCVDASYCALGKQLAVTSGYQYRATCIHYAKVSLLNTQKISNVSNIITF